MGLSIRILWLVVYCCGGVAVLCRVLSGAGELHTAGILLTLAWMAGVVVWGIRVDKACDQAGRKGTVLRESLWAVLCACLGGMNLWVGLFKSNIQILMGVTWTIFAVIRIVRAVRAAKE